MRFNPSRSILLGQHDRQDPEALRSVRRIFRAELTGLVCIVVDLPEDFPDTFDLERTKIVLAVWVVVFGEAIEPGDLSPDADLRFRGKGRDAGRANDATGHRARSEGRDKEPGPEKVVEGRDLLCFLIGHGATSSKMEQITSSSRIACPVQ